MTFLFFWSLIFVLFVLCFLCKFMVERRVHCCVIMESDKT